MTADTDRLCTRCEVVKSASEFHKDRKNRDGRSNRCKECAREYQIANKARIRARRLEYVNNNREQVLEGKRRYYHNNRAAQQETHRRWLAENADAAREQSIRRYRDGGRPADKPWPKQPIAYTTAHCRVKAIHGAAKNHSCSVCGKRAHAWSYDYSDPNPLFYQGTGPWAGRLIPYSPDPDRYDPLCRSCHVKRDRYGAA